MNKFFKITFCALSILFSQVALSETVMEHRGTTWSLREDFIKEAIPQINSDGTIVVDSINCNMMMVVLYEGKLKVYYGYPPLEELGGIQDLSDDDKKDAPHIYSDSNDPIFHASVVNLEDSYFYNTEHCCINAEKSINIQYSLIESPHIVLKAREVEIEESFLINAQTIELQSNNALSLLSSIKLTLKDKADLKFLPVIMGSVNFNDNFVVLICISASKVELQCLPESFYLDENTICFI